MKVSLMNKYLKKQYAITCAKVTFVISTIVIFVDIPNNFKVASGIAYILLLICIYPVLWYIACKTHKASLKIGETKVEIKSGDIFSESGLKVIAFNEYFDTLVDDKIIARASLNGQYIINCITDVDALDEKIEKDEMLAKSVIDINDVRSPGKTVRYKLGSCILNNDGYILTAFSKINVHNQAELTMQEYINFLLNFWNETNRIYAQRPVTIPIFGAGITRFKNGFEDVDVNELLKIMIWTFKISKVKFASPAKLTIIIGESLHDRINLYDIKESGLYGV